MEETGDIFKDSEHIRTLLKEGRNSIRKIDEQIRQLPEDKGPQPSPKPAGGPETTQTGKQAINKTILEKQKAELMEGLEKKFDDLIIHLPDKRKTDLKPVFHYLLTVEEKEKEVTEKREISASQAFMNSLLSSRYFDKASDFEKNTRDITDKEKD